jgi:hypothetical protein
MAKLSSRDAARLKRAVRSVERGRGGKTGGGAVKRIARGGKGKPTPFGVAKLTAKLRARRKGKAAPAISISGEGTAVSPYIWIYETDAAKFIDVTPGWFIGDTTEYPIDTRIMWIEVFGKKVIFHADRCPVPQTPE